MHLPGLYSLLTRRMKHFSSFFLAFWLLLTSCSPNISVETTSTPTPSVTPIPTATPPSTSTFTPTPIPIPKNLLDQKELLEQNGFIFRDREITHKDEAGKEWDVISFNNDGSAVIKALDNKYKGTDLSITPDVVAQITVELLNAEHDPILTFQSQDSGKVERMFLPNVDGTNETEAGWVTPIEISQDAFNPTRIDSASAIHTKHLLYSALLGPGSEPFPEGFPNTRFYMAASVSINNRNVKMGQIGFNFGSVNEQGESVPNEARILGYGELNTSEGRVIFPMIQFKISDSGESRILFIGYSGEALNMSGFIPNDLNYLYRSVKLHNTWGENNSPGIFVMGLQRMPGVEWLYYNDPDNQPSSELELQDDIQWIESVSFEDLQQKGTLNNPVDSQGNYDFSAGDITESQLIDNLQQYILYPSF